MKTSSDISTRKLVIGSAAIAVLAAVIFAFFQVKTVEVMGNDHYSDDELKERILKSPMTSNTILAPLFYAKDAAEDFPYIENFNVRRSGRSRLIISVKEKNVVGCIPYLDSYIYFDRNGYFVEGSKTRDTKVAFFDGIQVRKVVMEEKLPIKETVMNTAIALSTIFAKNDMVPDHILFDDNYEISLLYGDITVQLGKDQYLEDKMTRAIAILPQLTGQKGILHMENISRNSKTVTFEGEEVEITAENWNGGYDENGDYTMWMGSDGYNTQSTLNPLAALYERDDRSNASRFIGNAQFDYKIHGLEDLRLNLNLGMDYSHSDGVVNVPYGAEQSAHNQSQNGRGLYNPYNQTKRDMTLEAYADYSKEINKHSFGVMAGYSWQHFYTEDYSISMTQPDPVAGSQETLTEFTNATEYFLVSFFGRANYSYDNRYMLTATVRWDGTSRFVNNKWGFFPSVAFGWNIKGESFLKNVKAVSDLKLRLSWGQTGQQDLNAGDYPALATYMYNSNGSMYMFNGQMIIPIKPNGYNADLKWETTTTYNVGIDYGFFDGRLYGALDVYYRETTDLLNSIPVPAGANLTNYLTANIGSLVNKGVEFEIGAVALQTQDWNWTIGANFAYNDNRITKLTTNDDPAYTGVETGGISGGVGNNVQRHMVGYAANTFYLYEQIYDENGAPIPGAYVDQNGDGVIDSYDRVFNGQAAPKWTIGFNTSLSWKNLTLAIAGHGNLGQMVYNNNASRLSLLSDLWTNNFVRNCIGNAMSLGFNNAAYLSDYWLEDGSFFKIDRITLSYLFDLDKGGALSIFGTVQNVATFTKYSGIDPEVFNGIDNNLYPRPRTYIIGLKYNF